MNISIALKILARINKRITELNSLLVLNNRVRVDEERLVPLDLLAELKTRVEEYATLKGKLSKASVPMVTKLSKLEKLKGLLNVIRTLNTSEAPEVISYGMSHKEVPVVVGLSKTTIEEEKANLQRQIDQIQDELDLYNATTLLD